jgi:hypothetical protein
MGSRGEPALNYEQGLERSSKNLRFNGGNENGEPDGTSYSKVIDTPWPNPNYGGGYNGNNGGGYGYEAPDWQKFSYGVLNESLEHHPGYDCGCEGMEHPHQQQERKTNAMGTVQKLIGGNGGGSGSWYDHLEKRGLEAAAPLMKRDAERANDDGWPDHIQQKAMKMMKSASSMQDRGQALMDSDPQYNKKKVATPAPAAIPAVPALPADIPTVPETEPEVEVVEVDEIPDISEIPEIDDEEEEEEPEPVVAPTPKRKTVPAKGKGKPKAAPEPAAAPAPAPKKVGPKIIKEDDEDPMMRNELPKPLEKTKKPKAPKQARPAPKNSKQTPKKKGRKPQQDNMPQQGRNAKQGAKKDSKEEKCWRNGKGEKKGKGGDRSDENSGKKASKIVNKRDAIPDPIPEAEPEADAKMSSFDASNQQVQKPPGNPAGRLRADRGAGKKPERPNLNQSCPRKPEGGALGKGKGKAVSMESEIREHFDEGYVEEIITEMCEYDVEEEEPIEGSLRKRQTVNRRVLPCGPPTTIRRILGSGEVLPTPVAVAAAPAAPMVTHAHAVGAPAIEHFVAAAELPVNVVNNRLDNPIDSSLLCHQNSHGQLQIAAFPAEHFFPEHFPEHHGGHPAAAPAAHHQSFPSAVPVSHHNSAPFVHENAVSPMAHHNTHHNAHHDAAVPCIHENAAVSCTHQSCAHPQAAAVPVVQKVITEFVTMTKIVEVPVPGPTATEHISVEHMIEKPVTRVQTVEHRVSFPVTHTRQVTLPVITQVHTKKVEVPVTRVLTKEIAYPVTSCTTEVIRETVFPEVHAVPKEREIEVVRVVEEEKQIWGEVEVTKQVPVTKTILVCPVCECCEDECDCGTFDVAEERSDFKSPASGLEQVARNAEAIEAMIKKAFPGELAAQAAQ